MSFVSIIATTHYITVMTDGRVVDSDGQPIQENYRKFIQPSPCSFVAFAGNREPCEYVANLAFSSPWLSLHDKAVQIQQLLTCPGLSRYRILLAFGGRDSSGLLSFITMSTLQPEISHHIPSQNNIAYGFLNSNLVDSNLDLTEILARALLETGYGIASQTLNAQQMINDQVAQIDPSVNTTTFSLIINSYD